MEFPTPAKLCRNRSHGKSMDLSKQGIPNTCELFEDISRVSGLSPAHLGRQISFPAKADISIPLSDWSRDSVAPTHK